MPDWPVVRLGDHVDLHVGFAFKSDEFTTDPDDVRLVRGANIGQGTLKWDQERRFPTGRYAAFERYHLRPGDVVLAMDRPWIAAGLKWAVVSSDDVPALLVQRVARLRGTATLTHEFLQYVVGSPELEAYVKRIVTGVNVPHISASQIEGYRFRLPPTKTQRDIVRLLCGLDGLIDNNRRRIDALVEMARVIYREWFVHLRFPDHESVELVDSDLGPIPKDWGVAAFSDLAQFINGFAFKPNEHWMDMGLPIVKIKELKSGVTAETPRYSGTDINERYLIDDGDVLFSWSADLDAYVWSGGPALLNQHLFAVRPHELSELFLFHSLRSRMKEFRTRSQGTTMKHIQRSALSEVRTVVPDGTIRRRFEESVGPMLELQLNLARQNRVLSETRDLLLPRLLAGELNVSDLDLHLEPVG